jgi:biotin synthase
LLLQVQRCTLLSIKTGGCPENCSYCSQSSHWSDDTGLKAEKLMDLEPVYEVRNKLTRQNNIVTSRHHLMCIEAQGREADGPGAGVCGA